jgi:Ni/Co efflux regulator RcnB
MKKLILILALAAFSASSVMQAQDAPAAKKPDQSENAKKPEKKKGAKKGGKKGKKTDKADDSKKEDDKAKKP